MGYVGEDSVMIPRIPEIEPLIKRLEVLPRLLNAAYRRAARLTGTPALKVAKAYAPKRKGFIKNNVNGKTVKDLMIGGSGQLRKSLGVKIFTVRKTGNIGFVMGPRKGYHFYGIDRSGYKVKGNPTRYAHLVEKGFLAKLWGTGKRKRVPAKPFLRPAYMLAKTVVEEMTTKAVTEAIKKLEAKK